MQRVVRLVVCVVILLTGCGTSPEPILTEAVPDPTAVSPGELLERYQQATTAYEAGEVDRFCELTAATPSMIDFLAEEHQGRSELLGFDIDSGELVVRVAAPAEGDQHELNDLVVDAGGAVLVGDAPVGAIYRLSPGAETFETIVAPGSMFSPQGIVILPDDGQTLIADYSRGLCLMRSDGSVQILKSPPDAWLGGIDGLSLAGRRELIAVQNGITPNRVVRIRLTEKVDGVEGVDVLDLAHPEHDQPTLGEVVGDDFLYVANSLWGAWDRKGNLVEGRKLSPPVILRIELD